MAFWHPGPIYAVHPLVLDKTLLGTQRVQEFLLTQGSTGNVSVKRWRCTKCLTLIIKQGNG